MSLLTVVKNAVSSKDETTLEEILAELQKYGQVRLGQYGNDDDFWYCSVDMHVVAAGASFKVSTDFKQPNPLNAARTCLNLVTDALAQIGAKA